MSHELMRDLTQKNPKDLNRINKRSLARLSLIEAIFELEHTSAKELLSRYETHPFLHDEAHDGLEKPDFSHFKRVFLVVESQKSILEDQIAHYLPEGWPINRLDPTLKATLIAAAAELQACPEITPKVIVSEYLNAGAAFFEVKEVNFANGVLNALATHVRGSFTDA